MTSFRSSILAIALLAAPAAVLADEDHPALPPTVDAFHTLLAKDWHAKEGPERLQSACANVEDYKALSAKIIKRPVPDKVEGEQWKAAATAMNDASTALGAYCASGNAGNVTSGLTALHDRFHDLVKLVAHK